MDIPERTIEIEVTHALPDDQVVLRMSLPEGTTVQQAVALSGILDIFSQIVPSQNKLGIFGKLVQPGATLRNHDRVEIYRPLMVDPKEGRRKRAQEFKTALSHD
ncbi:MAG: RnfH family protein [Nitrosospira sp.]|nr:RnfH family protein [Nitrosospira sp.]